MGKFIRGPWKPREIEKRKTSLADRLIEVQKEPFKKSFKLLAHLEGLSSEQKKEQKVFLIPQIKRAILDLNKHGISIQSKIIQDLEEYLDEITKL